MTDGLNGRLQGALFTECASWIWDQLQEEGIFIQGELIEFILTNERKLGIQGESSEVIIAGIADLTGEDSTKMLDSAMIGAVLSWEDEFLALANIPRMES